jgi:5-methylcytosine-specific restriction endonuclease McrA
MSYTSSKVGKKQRDEIKAEQDYTCAFCTTRETMFLSLEIHHVIPASRGGTNDPKNLVALCANHHRVLHSIMERAGLCN